MKNGLTGVMWAILVFSGELIGFPLSPIQNPAGAPSPLSRHYEEGERLSYRMTGTIRNRAGTTTYAATARGVVKRDAEGRFFEEYEWSDLVRNGAPVELPLASREFRQVLSLSPDYPPAVPDLSKVHARLIGPTTDFLTFYSDMWLALRQPNLRRAGDRAVVSHGQAHSWADGTRVLLGEDAIDFVIVLGEADTSSGVLNLTVRHVPPEQPRIKLPAAWMRVPVADVANNWVQVARAADGRYVASVGKETFDAQIRLSAVNGKIVSARLDNPVEVLERQCSDEALTACGKGIRYRIMRQIEIAEIP